MYGQWVDLFDYDFLRCRVWVWCTPGTPDAELRRRAIEIVQMNLTQEATPRPEGAERMALVAMGE